jgi:cyclohexadienyl dehydratase
MGTGALMRGICGALAACAILLGAAGAQAQARLDDILARGVLRVGLTGDYKPFSLKAPDGSYAGVDVDMAANLAASLGVKLELVQTAWPNLMADLTGNKFDIAMGGITVTLARQKTAYFSIPVMWSGKTPIVRCADQDKYATLESIDKPEVRVITNPGGTNEKFDRANLHAANLIVFPDNTRIFDEVAAGRADVMITDAIETRVQHKLHPDLCPVHPEAPFDHSELGYLLPRDIGWKLYVDQWLHQQQENGSWKAAVAKQLD